MTDGQQAKLTARPVGTILVAGVVLGTVLGWYVRDFTATRDVFSEAKVRLTYCIQSAMGNNREDWMAEGFCSQPFQIALEKFFNRAGDSEEERNSGVVPVDDRHGPLPVVILMPGINVGPESYAWLARHSRRRLLQSSANRRPQWRLHSG